MKTSNKKYEITDIAHETYPFLHRIRALQDIGKNIKAGDLGGFVESESNLAVDPDDSAWIFDDAIVAGEGYVDQDSCLHGNAIVCDRAYVTHGAVLSGNARAEDDSFIIGAVMEDHARVSGSGQIVCTRGQPGSPRLSGHCQVGGIVRGNVYIQGSAVLLPGEEIVNDMEDTTFCISDQGRSILRAEGKDTLKPSRPQSVQAEKPKKRGMER